MTNSFPASQASCELVFPLVVLTPKSLEFSLRSSPRFVLGRAKLIVTLLAFLELNHNGLTGTQSSLGRPDFYFKYYLKTEILTLENVTCTLLLLKRPITSQKGALVGEGRGGGEGRGCSTMYHNVAQYPDTSV